MGFTFSENWEGKWEKNPEGGDRGMTKVKDTYRGIADLHPQFQIPPVGAVDPVVND